jgi:pyridoxal phosphate enzyme (YggS family)
MNTISVNIESVRARIAAACQAAGRPSSEVTLLAVSKTFGPEAVREAAACGQRAFGENYLQEAIDKMAALGEAGQTLQWHCIGPIQSNKTRWVAEHFDWAHTVDRLKIAQRLSEQRPPGRPPLNVCIQVNIDGGPNKAGVPPEQALQLARDVAPLPGLALRGLMTIPEPAPDYAAQRALHERARALLEQLRADRVLNDLLRAQGRTLDTLSMGMTADLEAAIAAGSTMVRVGTAIFGGRTAKIAG